MFYVSMYCCICVKLKKFCVLSPAGRLKRMISQKLQYLHTCPLGGLLLTLTVSSQIFFVKFFLSSSFVWRTQTTFAFSSSFLHSHCDISLVLIILCISSLQIQSAKLTPYILWINCIFTAFIFPSSVICRYHYPIATLVLTLHYVRPDMQLCWCLAISLMQLTHR